MQLPSDSIAQALASGLKLHQASRLAEAEVIYRQIIQQDPSNSDALHLLGAIALQYKHYDSAIELCRRAIQLKSDHASYHNNLGIAYQALQKFDEALMSYREALWLNPIYAAPHNNIGRVHELQGRAEEAAASYRRALDVDPKHFEAHYNLGRMLLQEGKAEEAVGHLETAKIGSLATAQIYVSFGQALVETGRPDKAIEIFEEATRRFPESKMATFFLSALRGGQTPAQAPSEYVALLFDEYATRFESHLVQKLNYRGPELLYDAVCSVDTRTDLDILDLGCGTGLCGQQFKDRARYLAGVDLSPRMLEQARRRNIYDELQLGDIVDVMRTRLSQFDLVLAADVFIYIGDLELVFESASNSLRTGGLFAFTIESHDGVDYALGATGRYKHSVDCLRRLAAKHGFLKPVTTPIPLRTEGEKPVQGMVITIRRVLI